MATAGTAGSTARAGEPVPVHPHRWLGVATGSIALVLAGVLLSGRLLPYELFLSGAALLLGLGAIFAAAVQPPAAPAIPIAPDRPLVAIDYAEPCPHCGRAEDASEPAFEPEAIAEDGPVVPAAVTTDPAVIEPEPLEEPIFPMPPLFDPGDRLWSSWTVASGELPTTPFVAAFEEVEYAPPETEPPGALASLAVSAARPSAVASSGGDGIAPPALPTPEGFTPPLDAGFGSYEPDGGFSELELEALTPIPPHLRPPFSAPAAGASRELPRPRTWDSRCATCRAPVKAIAGWQRCPDCQRPLCHGCLVRTMRSRSRGRCPSCASLVAMTEPIDGPPAPTSMPDPDLYGPDERRLGSEDGFRTYDS